MPRAAARRPSEPSALPTAQRTRRRSRTRAPHSSSARPVRLGRPSWRCSRPPRSPRARPPPTTASAGRAHGSWPCRHTTSPGSRCCCGAWQPAPGRVSSTCRPVSVRDAFSEAAATFDGDRRYTALVPTQLVRLLAGRGRHRDPGRVRCGARRRCGQPARPARRGPAGGRPSRHDLRHERDLRRLRLRRRFLSPAARSEPTTTDASCSEATPSPRATSAARTSPRPPSAGTTRDTAGSAPTTSATVTSRVAGTSTAGSTTSSPPAVSRSRPGSSKTP